MKTKIYLGLIAFGFNSIAQTPTGTAPSNSAPPNILAQRAWYRGGNNLGGTAGGNNIFGTMWNSPIYTQTNGKSRMIVNGDKTTTIAGYAGQVTDGFVGIGVNNLVQGFPWNAPSSGPISLLHLNSGVGGFVQQTGWRPWMNVGTYNSLGSDNMYLGLKYEGSTDRQDAVINWGDNTTLGGFIT